MSENLRREILTIISLVFCGIQIGLKFSFVASALFIFVMNVLWDILSAKSAHTKLPQSGKEKK